MNDRQLWKYRAEWAKAHKALRTAGHCNDTKPDDIRKRWHLLIGAVITRGPQAGQPKSSLHLTNAEFDRFLKRCAATSSPDSLKAQLDLDDQPLVRLRHATDPLLDLIKMGENAREAYLAGIYSNCQRARVRSGQRELPVNEMPDADLQTVVIALTHTVMHKLGAKHDHPTTGKGPKAKFAHDVGAKTGQIAANKTTASRSNRAAPVVPVETEPEGGWF